VTNEKESQILRKAIEKAVKGGFGGQWIVSEPLKGVCFYTDYYDLIFHHSFARAFWSDRPYHLFVNKDGIRGRYMFFKDLSNSQTEIYYQHLPAWQHHLQQMVLEEEPLKYIERFL